MADETVIIDVEFNSEEAEANSASFSSSLEEVSTAQANLKTQSDELDSANEELADSTEKATDSQGGFNAAVAAAGGPIKRLIAGIRGVTAAATAFIATPLGAVIGIIAAAIGSLVAFFRSSEEGQDAWNKVSRVAGVILGNLSDIVANLGGRIFEVITNTDKLKQLFVDVGDTIQENIINRFTSFSVILRGFGQLLEGDITEGLKTVLDGHLQLATGVENFTDKAKEGYDSLKESVEEFNEETLREIEQAKQLADLEARLDREERKLIVERAKVEAEVAELRVKAREDEEFSAQQRLQFLRDANALQEELLKRDEAAAKGRLEARRLENSFSKSTKENLDEEARLEAELFKIRTRRLNEERALQRELIRVRNEVEKQQQDQLNRAEEASQREIDAENERAILRLENDIKEVERIEDRVNKEIELEMLKKNQLLANDELIASERALIEEQFQANRISIIEQGNKELLDQQKKADQERERLRKIEEDAIKANTDTQIGAIGAIGAALEQGTTAQKFFAAAEATLNTFRAANQVLADPRLGFAAKFIGVAATLATGFKNVKAILSTSTSGGGAPQTATATAGGSFQLQGPIGANIQQVSGSNFVTQTSRNVQQRLNSQQEIRPVVEISELDAAQRRRDQRLDLANV